jgi:hypothetical protein
MDNFHIVTTINIIIRHTGYIHFMHIPSPKHFVRIIISSSNKVVIIAHKCSNPNISLDIIEEVGFTATGLVVINRSMVGFRIQLDPLVIMVIKQYSHFINK